MEKYCSCRLLTWKVGSKDAWKHTYGSITGRRSRPYASDFAGSKVDTQQIMCARGQQQLDLLRAHALESDKTLVRVLHSGSEIEFLVVSLVLALPKNGRSALARKRGHTRARHHFNFLALVLRLQQQRSDERRPPPIRRF